MKVDGKVWVVTGGGSGMGRELVLQLLRRGARVAAVDRNPTGLDDTAEAAGAARSRLSTHVVDITDRTAVRRLPAEVVAVHGVVDGLINNAGIIQPFVPVAELDDETIAGPRREPDGHTQHGASVPATPGVQARGTSCQRVEHGRLLPVPGPDDVWRE